MRLKNVFKFPLLAILLLGNSQLYAQNLEILKHWAVPDVEVKTVAHDSVNHILYLGGGFQYIGPYEESVALVDANSGVVNYSFPNSNINVKNSVADGNGGWFICGYFTRVGDSLRSGLAHIDANGQVTGFNVQTDQGVNCLALYGDTLIIGGDFMVVEGQVRSNLAAIDITSGQLLNWAPSISWTPATGVVSNILIIGNTLYICGLFDSVSGEIRNNLAAFNLISGLLNSWNPSTNGSTNDLVYHNNLIYVCGGSFTSIGGQTRNSIASVDANTGIVTNWNPNPTQSVFTFELYNDLLYVGGTFTSFGGQSRNKIASFDLVSGNLTNWNPNVNNIVRALKVIDNKLYIGGNFSSVSGIRRFNLAAFDLITDQLLPWDPKTNDNVIHINGFGNNILIGGYFSSIGGEYRSRLAAIDSNNGQLLPWNPESDGIVYSMLLKDTTLFVGGGFTLIGGVNRSGLATLSPSSGQVYSWNPNTNSGVTCMDILDNSLYVAGGFTTINGQPRNLVAGFDLQTGLLNSFNPTGFSGTNIYSIKSLVAGENSIYLGGAFSNLGGQPRNYIAELDKITGQATAWSANASGQVNALKIQDNLIYVGGVFTLINGQSRNRIAAINRSTGQPTAWNPNANGAVKGIEIMDSLVFLAGDFNLIGGQSRHYLAAIGIEGAQAISWNPSPTGEARCMKKIGEKIIMGGIFTNILNVNHSCFVAIGHCQSTVNEITINVCDSLLSNGQLFTNSGVYTQNLPNMMGCDSTLTINLTILSNSAVDTKTACDSYTWIDGNTYMSSTSAPTFILQNVSGCDSIITLNLTIMNSTSEIQTQTACDSFTWPINNQTYTASGQYTDIIPNVAGCDSIITLDLTIIPDLPLTIENSFSMPSDANSCVGEVAITLSGNADFELDFNNGSQVISSGGYSLVTNLCPGTHDLYVTDNCGDTLSTTIVIPVDSNYVFNNPFIDSLAQDSLGVTLTNCDIYYAGIDTAYIDSIWATGNIVNVIWNIVDSNGSNFDTTSYVLNNGNGVYWLQLSVFCPFKSVGEYFTVTEAIYFNNGSVSTAGLTHIGKDLFAIYPNPTNDQVHISFSGSDAELTVYDVQGKVVLKDQIQNQGIVSLQHFERGVYLFDFKNAQGHSIQRVVKQ